MNEENPTAFSGSYDASDVTFLLKPVAIPRIDVRKKERLIQSGAKHYSEMLSPEKLPDQRYLELYQKALNLNAGRLRSHIELLARAVIARPETSTECVIISLARAGTPIGVLLKRALLRMGVAVHHYSISIIRGRGIDRNALRLIQSRHGSVSSIFVDGWTGKGAIKLELERSLAHDPFGFRPFLAVVADPAGCADLAATLDDYVIPSGLLNGIVSGLVSRSVLTDDLVGTDDFHACAFQEEYREHDVSRDFITAIETADTQALDGGQWSPLLAHAARKQRDELMRHLLIECGIRDINRIKPGIAEATRAVLRRVPERLFVANRHDPEIRHLRHLAAADGIQIIERSLASYRAVTIIKSVGGE